MPKNNFELVVVAMLKLNVNNIYRIVSESSSKVRAFHVVSRECIAEVKVSGVVNKVLSGKS